MNDPATNADNDAATEELSIEETNELRIKLGLKPLKVDGSSSEKTAQDNYKKHREEEAKKAQRKELADIIEKEKERSRRDIKLTGVGLGEAWDEEDTEGDAAAWVLKMKSGGSSSKNGGSSSSAAARRALAKEKILAAKKAKELEEMDQAVYTSKDLAGLRVGHSLEDVTSTGDTILVLKDSTIDENEAEGDELVSVNIAERERLQKNLENKKAKPGYRPQDDAEAAHLGVKRDILDQYNDSEERTGFVLGAQGTVNAHQMDAQDSNGAPQVIDMDRFSLEYEKTREVSDYYTKEELATFKKPKKKKAKSKALNGRRQLLDDGDGDGEEQRDQQSETSMQVDPQPVARFSNSNIQSNVDNVNFVDDDDLQYALARARKQTIKKQTGSIGNELARIALTQQAAEDADMQEQSGGLVISDTSEFVRTLDTTPSLPRAATSSTANVVSTHSKNATTSGTRSQATDVEEGEKDDDDDSNEDIDMDLRLAMLDAMEKEVADMDAESAAAAEQQKNAVVEEEPLVSVGLAATLSLLNKKGLIVPVTAEERRREQKQKEHQLWLLKKRTELERAKNLRRSQGQSKQKNADWDMDDEEDDRERERAEREADRRRIQELQEKFRNYTPDVNVKYHDEYGRELSTKEAWNQLAYKFYGIVPGKMKTEKRLKKLQDELKLKHMNSLDTPLGSAAALQQKTQSTGQAYVTLSVGNRG
eukprot:jgi/Hompol1/4360/HPOL_003594-RA